MPSKLWLTLLIVAGVVLSTCFISHQQSSCWCCLAMLGRSGGLGGLCLALLVLQQKHVGFQKKTTHPRDRCGAPARCPSLPSAYWGRRLADFLHHSGLAAWASSLASLAAPSQTSSRLRKFLFRPRRPARSGRGQQSHRGRHRHGPQLPREPHRSI